MRREEFTVGQLYRLGIYNGAVTVLEKNTSGQIAKCNATSIPSDGASGYAVGCQLNRTDATLGMAALFINRGTATSCKFRILSSVGGYGIYRAGGPIASAGGDTTEVITISDAIATDISFVQHVVSDDSDSIVAQIAGVQKITITGSADPSTAHSYAYALLRENCLPEWDVVFAGTHTTVGGGVAEAITVTGATANDIPLVGYSATDDTDVIAKAVMTANTLTVTCSADPGATHGIHYAILRPRGQGKPSHYIAYAGVHTTVGGAAAEAITITGALATDIPIVMYNTTNDTDTILKSVVTANTLTVTMSADPSTAHKLAYMLLRAY